MTIKLDPRLSSALQNGLAIPACPLALTANRRFDEQRQRALIRYYSASGAGDLAIGVHTTQFEMHEPQRGLFKPILELAAEELRNQEELFAKTMIWIGGILGETPQAVREALTLRDTGYHAGLLCLNSMLNCSVKELITHCRQIAEIIPLIGFYLQPAVGGQVLSTEFWHSFAEIDNVVAIKIAPFNRYQTFDVVRAVVEVGRDDIALYTGNDDAIVWDLLTEYAILVNGETKRRRIAGGLLGHWACWTQKAVLLLEECQRQMCQVSITRDLLTKAAQVTDCNAVLFDAANGFKGCISGIHEVLRRQGLLAGIWCLNPRETLSTGQSEELDRIYRSYPDLFDDSFVAEHLDQWLK